MKYNPHEYQKAMIRFVIERGDAGLFADPGLGKTSTLLAAFLLLRRKRLVKRMLVIAPLRVATSVWPQEAQKWDDFQGLRVRVLHKDGKVLDNDSDIDVINPEGLPWLLGAINDADTTRWPWEMLVIDESTRFKHTDTQRFKTLKPMLPHFKRHVILTGTPAPNGLMDLFGQIYILDMGEALGKYVTHFRCSYFYQTGFGGHDWRLTPGAEKRLYERIKPLVLRMSGKDWLKLPPLVHNTIRVDLPAEARRAYDQMEALMIAQVAGKTLTAANAAAVTGKCRQIANGGCYYEEPGAEGRPVKKWQHVHEAKTEAVLDLVEELSGKPALIAYEFAHDLERLKRALGDPPHLGGGISPKRQRELELAWNGGELPVLLAQPQSVAHGLNLQGVGAAVIWHSNPWDLELLEQFDRRVWRQGQKERVVVHSIVARRTVDEAVMSALAGKAKTQGALLAALKTYIAGSGSGSKLRLEPGAKRPKTRR